MWTFWGGTSFVQYRSIKCEQIIDCQVKRMLEKFSHNISKSSLLIVDQISSVAYLKYESLLSALVVM